MSRMGPPGITRTWRALVAAAMLVASTCGGAVSTDDEKQARNLALEHTLSPDAAVRLAACGLLAKIGRQQDLPALHARLADEDGRIRATAEAAIWAIWGRSGDPAADVLFERGLVQMREGRLPEAVETFSRVIVMRPSFTEAWNKRATVYFLLGQDDLSLKDCDEVLKSNPRHFGVLAGYGQIHLRKGDLQLALDYFEQALAVNPNMAGVRASIDAVREMMIRHSRRFI